MLTNLSAPDLQETSCMGLINEIVTSLIGSYELINQTDAQPGANETNIIVNEMNQAGFVMETHVGKNN